MPSSICPDCDEEVYVDAESEQGDRVTCEECGATLVVVGLDPIELDIYDPSEDEDYDDSDDDDYEDDPF